MATTVLVVEDEQIVALDIKLNLQRFGYQVVGTCPTAEEALALLANRAAEHALPDIILMDIHLAGQMDGLTAATIVKERYAIPVIMATAYADDETLTKAALADPYGYITKPFDPGDLRTAIVMATYRRAVREKDAQLARAQRMEAIGRLAGGLAHDFNNLITVIMGYTRLILDDLSGQDDHETVVRNAQGILDTTQRSTRLTRQLLSFARAEALSPTVVDLSVQIEKIRPILERALPNTIELHFAPRHERVCAYVDAGHLDHVLLNLILNARDAMPSGGTVTLTTDTLAAQDPLSTLSGPLDPGVYAVIRIADTGEGIDAEVLPRIFEPFYTTKDAAAGSGLGLSTAYTFIKSSGGAIDVTSTVGRGTCFSLYLPVSTEMQEAATEAAADVREVRGTETVLVVAQEEAIRGTVAQLLRARGFVPLAARSVGDALLLLERHSEVAAVVSDLSGPYLSPADVVQRYRGHVPTAGIVLFGDTSADQSGAYRDLELPLDPHVLLQTVREAIDCR